MNYAKNGVRDYKGVKSLIYFPNIYLITNTNLFTNRLMNRLNSRLV